MNDEIAKVYVTKYACSTGIKIIECRIKSDGYASRLLGGWSWFSKKEWFRTFDEAVADANARRAKRIASLKKQLAKLEAREWKDPAA